MIDFLKLVVFLVLVVVEVGAVAALDQALAPTELEDRERARLRTALGLVVVLAVLIGWVW